jgi:hypothetical protein
MLDLVQRLRQHMSPYGSYFTSRELRRLLYAPAREILSCYRLLGGGNTKLGSRICSFNLPVFATCPGATAVCKHVCYADTNRFVSRPVLGALWRNWVLTFRDDFEELLLTSLDRTRQAVVRIHAAGDFFSVRYARIWLRIARQVTHSRFFAYTRSWRIERLQAMLAQLAAQPNFRLWYSLDAKSGWPAHVPRRVRLAYLQTHAEDQPGRPVDLVFRVRSLRRLPDRFVAGALVCPHEQAVPHTSRLTCSDCRLCWSPLEGALDPRQHRRYFHGRLELPLVG